VSRFNPKNALQNWASECAPVLLEDVSPISLQMVRLIIAWDSIPAGAYLNAEFLKSYEDSGSSITVTPGSKD